MTRHPSDWQHYIELRDRFLDRYPDDSVGPELQSLISDDPDKRSDFVAYLHMMAALPLGLGQQNPDSEIAPFNPMPADSQVAISGTAVEPPRLSSWRASLVAGGAFSAAVFLFAFLCSGFRSQEVQPPIAYLNAAENCLWGKDLPPIGNDGELNAGRLRLISGNATLEMPNTQLFLEGPVDLELISPTRCRLHSGRVVVTSTNGGDGLVIRVPNGAISDFGAELGIFVSQTGEAKLHVYSGVAKAKHCGLGESLEASKCDTILIRTDAIKKLHRERLPPQHDLYSLGNRLLNQRTGSPST